MLKEIRQEIAMAVSLSRKNPDRDAILCVANALYSITSKLEEMEDDRRGSSTESRKEEQ